MQAHLAIQCVWVTRNKSKIRETNCQCTRCCVSWFCCFFNSHCVVAAVTHLLAMSACDFWFTHTHTHRQPSAGAEGNVLTIAGYHRQPWLARSSHSGVQKITRLLLLLLAFACAYVHAGIYQVGISFVRWHLFGL